MSHPKRRSFRAPATLAVAGLAAALLVPLGLATASPAAAVVGECPPGFLPSPGTPGTNPVWSDDNVAVFAGGDFVADGQAAESEGLMVVMGDATFDKSNDGRFNVGWVGVGSQAAPTPGSTMLAVGGALTVGAGTVLDVGSGAREDGGPLLGGDVQVGGTATPTYPAPEYELNNGTLQVDMGAAAVSDWAGFAGSLTTSSDAWVAMAETGTSVVSAPDITFTGDGTSNPQVFTVTVDELNSVSSVFFANIADDVPVIINVIGTGPVTFNPTYFANDGVRADDFTSADFGVVAQRTMWNFADTSSVTFGGSSQFLGSVLAPNADFDITASMNGRVYTGGDIHMHGSGNELHNYPWIGADFDCVAGEPVVEAGEARLTKVLATSGVAAPDRWFFGWMECVGGDLGGSTFYREGMIQAGATIIGRDLPVGAQCTLHEDPDRAIDGQADLPPGFLWADPVWAVNGQVVDVPTFTVPGPGDPDVEVTATNTLLGQFSVEKVVTGPAGGYIGDREFDILYTCDADAYGDDGAPLGDGTDSGTLAVAAGTTEASAWFPVGTVCQISEQTPATEPGDFGPVGDFHWEAPVITPSSLTIGADDVSPIGVTVTNTYAAGEPTTGSFTIDKVVQNPSGLTFTDAFTGDWTCTLGQQTQSGTWTTSSTGNPVVVNGIPVGAQCTVTERAAAAVSGGTWDAPVITPATFTISGETAVAVTVTNTLRAATAATGSGGALPATGGTVPVWAIAVGGGLLVAGAAVVVIALVRRRRS